MYGIMPMQQQYDERFAWFQQLLEIIKRSEDCLSEPERLEEFDLVSVCRDFMEQLEEVTIQEGKNDFWDCIIQLNDDARNAIINYYMNAEEESAKRVCQDLVSAKDIIEQE